MSNDNQHIWSLDCIAICTVLGFALDAKNVGKLCRKFNLSKQGKRVDSSFGFYLLHKACHRQGGVLPKRLTKLLNERYRRIIETVRATEEGSEDQITSELEVWIGQEPAGIMWALLTDPRESFQCLGVYLVHQIAYGAFRDSRARATTSQREEEEAKAAVLQENRARASLAEQKAVSAKLRRRLRQSERKVSDLEATCQRQEQRIAELEATPDRETSLRRRIRILEHELGVARNALDSASRVTGAVNAEEPCQTGEADSLTCCAPTHDRGEAVDCGNRGDHCTVPGADPCPLDAMHVAVIGGLDRLEPHYRRVVEAMGGQFLFHNGDCQGGCHRLRTAVCQADLVIFITRVNSHSALKVVKGLCKKTGRQFMALRETSPTALEAVLLGAA
jgi:hypothetical protein